MCAMFMVIMWWIYVRCQDSGFLCLVFFVLSTESLSVCSQYWINHSDTEADDSPIRAHWFLLIG